MSLRPFPYQDSYDRMHTRELNRLQHAVAQADQELSAAQARLEARVRHDANAKAAAAQAQAQSTAASLRFTNASAAERTAANSRPLATEAHQKARAIVGSLDSMIPIGRSVADALIRALTCLVQLSREVETRKGKNELISPLVVSGVTQAKVNAEKALSSVQSALQTAALAIAAAQEAAGAAEKVGQHADQLHAVLGGPEAESEDVSLRSLSELIVHVATQNHGVTTTYEHLMKFAQTSASQKQEESLQVARALADAQDDVSRATAAASAAAAALTAAEVAVA